ncbi:NUDIX hydrolase [Lentzea sokolovensis]|uniref:NUDIX hydrolase n=1 Tax=Lentzea sokolovensis TaxID=3095429 RepID=UPI003873CB3F
MEQFNVLVGAVVTHKDSFLLLQRSSNEHFLPSVWGIPAGKVEYEEDILNAVLRELREESGIAGSITAVTGSSWFSSQNSEGRIRNIQINFAIETHSAEVQLDSSSQAYLWVSWVELESPPVPIDDFTRQALLQARAHLKSIRAISPSAK